MLVAAAAEPMSTGPSQPAGNNLLWNGTFDGRAIRPWSLTFENTRDVASPTVRTITSEKVKQRRDMLKFAVNAAMMVVNEC